MVTLYSGTPGSGKSLHLIELIFRCLKWGRTVICNFPVKFTDKEIKKGYDKRFFYWQNPEITVKNLLRFAIQQDHFVRKKESQCLVVIDEAGGRFNVRDYQAKDRAEWIDFFSQHRKAGFDFILVAQQDRMIDRQIRGFVETEKKHRKINNFGPFAFLPIPVFVAVEHWYTAKQRVGADFFIFRKKMANKYDSMKMFEGFKLPPDLLKELEKQNAGNFPGTIVHDVFKKTGTDKDYNVPVTAIYNEDKTDGV